MRLTKHYVYRTTYLPTGEFYIGVRSSVTEPKDDKYLGSGSFTFFSRYNRKGYSKEIIAEFPSRDEAETYELSIISQNISNTLCKNLRVEI